MSDEYIRREDAICLIKHYLDNPPKNHSQLFISGMEDAYYRMLSNLNNFHSADVVQVRHGRWTHKSDVHGVVYCSECDYELQTNSTSYCPNCGAKMDARGEE